MRDINLLDPKPRCRCGTLVPGIEIEIGGPTRGYIHVYGRPHCGSFYVLKRVQRLPTTYYNPDAWEPSSHESCERRCRP